MSKFFSDLAKGLKPYVPGEQPKDKKYIKLNTNENPYPPSPRVIKAIRDAANSDLRLYPDPECDDLRQTVAECYGLDKKQVFVGNGSDEVLAFCFGAFFAGKKILFPDITYSFYPVYANLYGVAYEAVPLNENFEIIKEDYYKKNGGIVIPNPNAPTSRYLDIEKIEDIIKSNKDSVVIVDEAYIDFGGESCISLINKYPNLLVIHTLSKSRSLAGLRIGFAFGSEELMDGLNRVKNSFNSYTIDRIALAGASEALKDSTYFEETRKRIIETRDKTMEALKALNFEIIDSKANFIFISHKAFEAQILFQKLRERGILVRYFNKPRINNFLRVTIGTDIEMETFIKVLNNILVE